MPPVAAPEAPPAEALDLRESISLTEALNGVSVFNPDGTLPLHLIRPCIGKGKGRHLYEADMLEANAGKFAGWKMYIDHQSEQARKAAGGLPRSTRDLGGRIVESKWDPTVPADPSRGFGQGAVVADVRPTRFIKQLIEDDPEIIEASIAASATGVRPVVRGGQRVWLVEGIDDHGSVDWVTEAGAGGRVAALLEAAARLDEEAEMAQLDSMDDTELAEYLAESRPTLLEAMSKGDGDGSDAEDAADGGKDELEEEIQKLIKKGMPRKMATAIAKKKVKKMAEATAPNPEGGDMSDLTPEALQEALAESPEVLTQALAQSAEAQLFISSLVEAKLNEERDTIRAEAKADAERRLELRDLRDEAFELIAESRLPESWQRDLKRNFDLNGDHTPTAALDVTDDVDDDTGKVTKTASEKLREAVEADITRERERLAEVSPTRVRGQGPKPSAKELKESRKEDEGDEGGDAGDTKPKGEQPFWAQTLQEAGVDPATAYGE